jgi:hypothetical protein
MSIVEFGPHGMLGNNVPIPYVITSSSEYNSDSFRKWKAFDGGIGYFLFNATTGWLQVDVGDFNARILYSYSIRANTVPEPNRMPKDWTMQGSRDNVNWYILDTVTGEAAWGNGEIRNYICDVRSMLPGRYFRLNVTANNGDVAYCQVCELYLQTSTIANYLHTRRDRMNMRGVSTQNSLA